ncbi:MAG TPA: 3-deoxy-manno-octulosonate cytidylyltransferase [bacterium]|nr:3-deoxy-manno-octulosonate cytidylyltransferase [bacterium]HPN42365.1 3-deoxy-manno-octulosonate cytidylyltransferase [bacterium]
MKSGIVGIIPARYASSRFPGKPLALIAGKPMIQWVYERACLAKNLDQVIVATDDERIYNTVTGFGRVVMTPENIPSGTERAAYVTRDMDVEIVINIQGDEPMIDPAAIELVGKVLRDDSEAVMATLARRVSDPAELDNFDTARVVIDHKQHALYFSRAVIPYARDLQQKSDWPAKFPYYDQIGIYAYRKEFLLKYKDLPFSILEQAEKLEQLRALENGFKIRVGICNYEAVCVDKPEHIAQVEKKMKEMNRG